MIPRPLQSPATGIRGGVSRNYTFWAAIFLNELSQASLKQLADACAIRAYSLHAQAGGYSLIVRYGMSEGLLVVKRGGPRVFAKIETAFDLLLRVDQVDVHIVGYVGEDLSLLNSCRYQLFPAGGSLNPPAYPLDLAAGGSRSSATRQCDSWHISKVT